MIIKKYKLVIKALLAVFIVKRLDINKYNKDTFKKGDVLTYNWMAYVLIESVLQPCKLLKVTQVVKLDNNSVQGEYLILDDELGTTSECDVFWLRKLFWYERFPIWFIKFKILFKSIFCQGEYWRVVYPDEDRETKLLCYEEAKSLKEVFGGRIFIDLNSFKLTQI